MYSYEPDMILDIKYMYIILCRPCTLFLYVLVSGVAWAFLKFRTDKELIEGGPSNFKYGR